MIGSKIYGQRCSFQAIHHNEKSGTNGMPNNMSVIKYMVTPYYGSFMFQVKMERLNTF